MKHKLLPLLLCVLCCCHVLAQKKKQVVEGDDDINTALADSVKYKYPSFITGRVVYKDGNVGGSLMNYNFLLGEVQFIDPKGDTLSLANEATVKMITIGNDTFYYDGIYLMAVQQNAQAKIARNDKMRIADVKKAGGYGMYTSTGGIESYSSLTTSTTSIHLKEDRRMLFITKTTYYIGDKFDHFLPVSKKNIFKMFGKKKGLDDFINDNKIDFRKVEDLEKLIAFINEGS